MSVTITSRVMIICKECSRMYPQRVHIVECRRCWNRVCEGCVDRKTKICKWCKAEQERIEK